MTLIPFNHTDPAALSSGRKTATTRTARYGETGTTFEAFDMQFVLTGVYRVQLGDVARYYFQQEGLDSPQEFIRVWRKIHPRSEYDPEKSVYLHLFRRIEGNGHASEEPKKSRLCATCGMVHEEGGRCG